MSKFTHRIWYVSAIYQSIICKFNSFAGLVYLVYDILFLPQDVSHQVNLAFRQALCRQCILVSQEL